MKIRYGRISSKGQNTIRQDVRKQPDEVMFTDVISGAIAFQDRPQAKKILEHLAMKEVEQISVSSIDRLGRNTLDILQTIKLFTDYAVNVHIDNLGLDSLTDDGKPNHIFNLITSVMGSISQLERDQLRERQLEGIKAAKNAGTYKGRALGSKEADADFLKKYPNVVKLVKHGGMSNNLIAESCQVSPHTVKKLKEIFNHKIQKQ